MEKQLLHFNWKMKECLSNEYVNATVPGSVYNDLISNNLMDDPYWRDNEMTALKIMDNDFEYVTKFDVSDKVFASEQILLRFEGIDTIADIILNGELLGHVENMYVTNEFNVKSKLKKSDNELKVLLKSPTKFVAAAHKECECVGSTDAMYGFPHLRKAHCMFGWDWGPRLPDAGIWKDVMLLGINKERIEDVYITQIHDSEKVTLQFDLENKDYKIQIKTPTGELIETANSPKAVVIDKPMLWWPNGYGEQYLYEVSVILNNEEDAWIRKIGLRTMTIERKKDQYGESFTHVVNGIKIFAMGADYIPEDNILSRVTKERTFDLLKQCKDVNFNVIRVWGGGYYPNDFFYDICDELGLIVWQDFMFACAVYELTDEFEENIKREFIDNIKRIRHHASLGLWCGNNEMEMFVAQDEEEWIRSPKQKSDYIKMYEYIIPKILKEYDPNTFYWPASPSSGGGFDKPNDENFGDVHYWEVWHGNAPFTDFRKYYFRYISEFGFQSFPALKTVESFTLPEDRNVFSYVMEKHQRNGLANGKIMNYLSQTFLYPTDFGTLLYASQLLQAEAIRYGVEHFRRNRGRCMGTVYWQLNDCWPVASWSSIDYYGRWKALHYYAKRFFAPVLLSCEEEGMLTQSININVQPFDMEKSATLCVTNETMMSKDVKVLWSLRKVNSEVCDSGEFTTKMEPLSAYKFEKLDFKDADIMSQYIYYELWIDDKFISSGTQIFSVPKYFKFQNPELSLRVENDEIVVTSKAYARSVEILNENEDLILSDNYFDMNKGEKRVKVVRGSLNHLRVRSVFDIR